MKGCVKMKKIIKDMAALFGMILFLLGCSLLFTGCSHNAVTYSDGVGFETTMRPDTGNFGITFRYGKVLSVAVRENAEVEMQGAGAAGAGGGEDSSANANGSVKVKIGQQITGYYVEALKAGATAETLDKYTEADK